MEPVNKCVPAGVYIEHMPHFAVRATLRITGEAEVSIRVIRHWCQMFFANHNRPLPVFFAAFAVAVEAFAVPLAVYFAPVATMPIRAKEMMRCFSINR